MTALLCVTQTTGNNDEKYLFIHSAISQLPGSLDGLPVT
jgi:hypothetical protein